DACCFTGQFTQVVKLGFTHVTATLNSQAINQRAVSLESTLNANTVGDLTNSERTVQTTVTLGDNNTFERLQTLTITFFHFNLDNNGVARCKRRDYFAHLLSFDLLNNLVGHAALLRQASAGHRYINYRPAGGRIPPAASSLLQKASGFPEDQRVVRRSAQGTAANASAGCVHGCHSATLQEHVYPHTPPGGCSAGS